ncbi:MAG: restriction endonuclease, partial [Nitrososphaerota archaeon]|nr:restriction endonuclease [Nitrososphaerota archaeon]
FSLRDMATTLAFMGFWKMARKYWRRELVEQGIARINNEVASNLLVRLHSQDPVFFEQAVVDLVVAMGYGGADARATRTQLSNDGGIDGIIDQDVLGLSRVYIQAKRYSLDSSVGRPDIQSFVGALQGQQANQGVFITTGRFSSGAIEYAKSVPTRVVLIDGSRLAELMIRYRVGVQVKRTLQIVDIDEDFFE